MPDGSAAPRCNTLAPRKLRQKPGKTLSPLDCRGEINFNNSDELFARSIGFGGAMDSNRPN
jgi:hypothetical protein